MRIMKTGFALILLGCIGVLALIIYSVTLGNMDTLPGFGSKDILDDFALKPFFYGFIVLGIAGVVICIIDAYFLVNKDRKKRILLGELLLICGFSGYIVLILTVYISEISYHHEFDLFNSLDWFGVTPYSTKFFLLYVISGVYCLIQALLFKRSK